MVMNTKNYNLLKHRIEFIFSTLDIDFELCEIDSSISNDFKDNVLYYSIKIAAMGKLKPLSSISCLLYLLHSDNSMNLIVGNIYSIDESEDPVSLYEIVNQANIFSSSGKFIYLPVNGRRQIFYRSIVQCGENYSELDSSTLKFQIESFMSYLEYFFKLLKEVNKEAL